MVRSVALVMVSAVATFAATNVDDLVILTLLFGQGNPPRRVIAGQYLGFAALAFVRLPSTGAIFDRWGHRVAPFVLVALGLYILADAGSFSLLGEVLRERLAVLGAA